MLPREIAYGGVTFTLADSGANAVVAHGQTIALPEGKFTRLYLLAASANGDRAVTFRLGDTAASLTVQDWGGYLGQWDNRLWKQVEVPPPAEPAAGDTSQAAQRARRILARIRDRGPIMRAEYTGLVPGYIKRSPVAWFASHRHTADGANEPYAYAYLFAYAIDLPRGARTLTLPDDDRVRVMAVTLSNEQSVVRPAAPLYDTLGR
jgi:alpha-mannosidase